MIVNMTKYSFVLLSENKEEFIGKLAEIGLVDISRKSKPYDDHSRDLMEKANMIKAQIAAIRSLRTPEIKSIEEKILELERAVKSAEVWGEFSPAAIAGLREKGITLHLFSCATRSYHHEWELEYPIQVISEDATKTYFVLCETAVDDCTEILERLSRYETRLPAAPASVLRGELESVKVALDEEIAKVQSFDTTSLEAEYEATMAELDCYIARGKGEAAAENTLTVFTGFAPSDTDITAQLDTLPCLYYAEEATKDDNPPIKLKNGWFATKFESLTSMYGLPVYDEWDPTPILSIFFMLFFAICLGDAGYGIILLLFGIAVEKKWVRIEMFENIGTLIAILGAATIVVGTLLGTFFGMPIVETAWMPECIKAIARPLSGTVEVAGIEMAVQMVGAIVVGVLHLVLAMSVKAIMYTQRFGIKTTISTWGWLILIVGSIVVLTLGLGQWAFIGVGAVSALAIFVFNTPGRNPLINIGAGLWDTYQMASGLLGDVLSYIRLYALGLAGGMLGGAFNNLAGMVLPEQGATWQWAFFVLIVLLGHTLNILMSSLGAFVHPLRLNFLEYFKNAGYEGKGAAYNPLKK